MSWMPIPGYEGRYVISDSGVVCTVPRMVRARYGKLRRLPAITLATTLGGRTNDYLRVMLENPKRHAYVHVLVCEAFHGHRPSPEHQACHRNDEAQDNRASNLYWGTREQNDHDRYVVNAEAEPVEEDACVGVPF